MTTYKEIVGQKIRKVSSNPSEAQTGQMWYNTTVSGLKALQISEAWSSVAPLSVARDKPGAAGTQTASLAIGGDPALTSVDEYNGTGWQSAPAINTGRHGMGSGGTTSAAWKAGGSPPETTTATEEYDGSSWTTVPGTLNTGRYIMGSCGTQTAALCNGGYNTANVNNSEEYDGSTWSNGNAMNTARRTCADIGIQTAAVSFGGQPPPGPAQDDVEEYDGTSWTTVGNYPTNISDSAGSGTLTAGLAFGGNVPPSTTATKNYDGTTWTTSPASLGTAAKRHGGTPSGTNAAAISFGGDAPGSHVTTSEEFNKSTNIITAAAWSTGGTLSRSPTTHSGVGLGSTPAGVYIGGVSSPGAITATTELYNGSAWTSGTSTPLNIGYGGGGGTSAAAIVLSGEDPPGSGTTTLEGDASSSWTAGGTRNNAAQGFTYAGTQTSFVTVGGSFPPSYSDTNKVEMYDGTSWTNSPGTYPANTSHGGASGTSTAAIFYGGTPGTQATAYTWNGSSWTSASNMIEARKNMSFNENAPSSQAYSIGGTLSPPGGHSNVTKYNGTTWATAPSLGTAADKSASGGDESTGIFKCAGEYGPGPIGNQTEEFTVEVLTANVKGFSSS